MDLTQNRRKHYPLLLILIFAGILFSINLNKPFIGHHDWNGVWYSNFARNFTKYGLIKTKLGSVMNYDLAERQEFKFFTHYPPLLPILMYLSFRIFGVHEWSARIVPLIFSLGTITAIYFLGIRVFDIKTAILASSIASIFPIMIYFGKMPVQEVLVLGPVLLSIILYFNFQKNGTTKNLLILIVSLSFSHLINWSAYYVTPLFFIHYLFFGKSKNKFKIALIFPVFSFIMFFVHILHTFVLTGEFFGGGIIDTLLFRLNISQKPLDYTVIKFIILQARLLTIYFSKPILILSLIAVFWIAREFFSKRKVSLQGQLLIMLGAFGIIHNAVFRNMAFIHDYMIIYALPFFALSASSGFFLLLGKVNIKSIWIFFALPLLGFILLERSEFTSALISSNGFREGYYLGKVINQNSISGEKVLVLSHDFKESHEVFTGYYSDRVIEYDLKPEKFLMESSKDYRLIIAMPTRDTPNSSIQTLKGIYRVSNLSGYLVFDTHKSKL